MPRINIDLDFLTHPKVVSIDPLSELLFIRSLIYSAIHLTDGALPCSVLSLLAHNFHAIIDCSRFITEKNNGNIDDARSIEGLAEQLVDVGMWEKTEDGWMIHGYLEYQMSRKEVELYKKNKKLAGKAGAKSRWNKPDSKPDSKHDSKHDSKPIAKAWPNTNTNTNPNIKNKSKSTSEDEEGLFVRLVQKPIRTGVLDEVWITELKANPLYTGIDIDCQFKKAQSWIQTNGKGRQMTRKYFGNWLVRCIGDKPMAVPVKKDWIPV